MKDPSVPMLDVDAALVQRAVAGDQQAFKLLVLKYQHRIQRLIARTVRDPGVVEELAQETFLSAYRALAQFRGEAQFYTWLYRIAINTARKSLGDAQHLRPVNQTENLDDDAGTFSRMPEPSTEETPETALATKQLAGVVNTALEELPVELRQALVLREMEGLAYEDIAQLMGSPAGTVRSRIFRAREAIAVRIQPLLGRYSGKRW